MSLVTGTARTGEAAAVAEAPLFNGGANSTTAAEAMLAFNRQGSIEVALWEERGSGSTGGPSIIFNGRPTLTPNIAALESPQL
jgi:hypothetical protein